MIAAIYILSAVLILSVAYILRLRYLLKVYKHYLITKDEILTDGLEKAHAIIHKAGISASYVKTPPAIS